MLLCQLLLSNCLIHLHQDILFEVENSICIVVIYEKESTFILFAETFLNDFLNLI